MYYKCVYYSYMYFMGERGFSTVERQIKRLSFWWHWKKGEGRGRKNKRRGKERGEKGY